MPVYLRDIWPSSAEVEETLARSIKSDMYRRSYGAVFAGDERWNGLDVPGGDRFEWSPSSTYVRRPPYFEGMSKAAPTAVEEIRGARVIALLGDSVTTDHISPAGSIKKDSPAGRYLTEQGVALTDFNSYGSRRGNHEVLVRGTFANTRIRNRLAPGTEGGLPPTSPAGRSCRSTMPRCVTWRMELRCWCLPARSTVRALAGTGRRKALRFRASARSSPRATSGSTALTWWEWGSCRCSLRAGESADSLGLTGREFFDFEGLLSGGQSGFADGPELTGAGPAGGWLRRVAFRVDVRIDTPQELLYYQHGGILHYVLRQLLGRPHKARATGRRACRAAPDATNSGKVEEGSIGSRSRPAIRRRIERKNFSASLTKPCREESGCPVCRRVCERSTSGRYLDLDPSVWYQVVPIFPGVTQRMVNMAGERLARLATPRGLRDHAGGTPGISFRRRRGQDPAGFLKLARLVVAAVDAADADPASPAPWWPAVPE